MSIERPSRKNIQGFIAVQENKKQLGVMPAYSDLLKGSALFAFCFLFPYSVIRSQNPQGAVAKILYRKSITPAHHHFRHSLPAAILIGFVALWDYSYGVWGEKKAQ